MALSNAERQKKYRESRKEKVSELDSLRNLNEVFTSELNALRNEHNQLVVDYKELLKENSLLRNENLLLVSENDNLRSEVQHLTKKLQDKPTRRAKFMEPYSETNAFFYVKNGYLHLLCWPETEGTIIKQGLDLVPYSKVDRKFKKDMDRLISAKNDELRSEGLLPPDGA